MIQEVEGNKRLTRSTKKRHDEETCDKTVIL